MRFFKKTDLLIIGVLVIVSLVAFVTYKMLFSGQSAKAEIYFKSQLVKTVRLDEHIDKRFTVPENEHVVFHVYEDGSIQFEESDCPDQICIHAGKLKTVGETAACLPNKLIMKLVPAGGRNSNDLDMTVGN